MVQETFHYMRPRVALAALVGGTGGLTLAVLRGYHIPVRTTGLTALSCAASATACFGCERFVDMALTWNLSSSSLSSQPREGERLRRYASHAMGGMLGGSLLGLLFIRKPVRGALLFTPMMIVAAVVDDKMTALQRSKESELEQHQTTPTHTQ